MARQFESLEARRLLAAAIDPVIEWNNVLIDTLRADTTLPGPGWSSRNAAIMHAAIFDAVNAVDRSYEPFLTAEKAPRAVPLTAAVASAGWRVLSQLYPNQQSTLDDALATSLSRVKDGPMEDRGVALGIKVADAIVDARASDGADVVTPYTPGTEPGQWQPTTPDFTPAWGAGWSNVTPFSMLNAEQFAPPSPPQMSSEEYRAAFEQVKSLGGDGITTPTDRTAEQTEIANFWAYDRGGTGTPPAMYNQMVQVIAKQEHNSVVENARLFALANIAMADAGIAAWDCKFLDNVWRPIDGIRRADEDGNDLTEADETWTPLGAPGGGVVPNFTPPFPAYVSGHATFGAAAAEVLKDFYGTDNIQFELMSDELPGVEREFDSFTEAAQENGISRIYLGIHWNFDNIEGQNLGRAIADHVFANALTRQSHGHAQEHAPKIEFTPIKKHAITTIELTV